PAVVARQVSEYPINRIRFSPYINENCLLVSCGQSSIRFWRLKHQHLPASSVPLNDHARHNFTDFAFEAGYGEADTLKKRCVFSCESKRERGRASLSVLPRLSSFHTPSITFTSSLSLYLYLSLSLSLS